jgi:isoleucyl-tRNA synthetase
VWKSDDPEYPRIDAYGSVAELERDFGRLPTNAAGEVDLHRPFIDELTRPNPDDPTGRSTMRRIEDVLDVWFDSGSMPFAQVHYPFENAEWFDSHNPADFIVEYIGQTRGWFYTMHVLATALFDRPAFQSVLSHGIVLGSDGQKMSKSLRNYPDVSEVFDRDGADAMRWFLMSSSVIRGGNLVVTEEGIRAGVRELMLPLWSTYYFFTLYANTAKDGGYRATLRTDSPHVLDRYLLAKTRSLICDVTSDLEVLDSPLASEKLRDFADVLTNWYVRRSRDRFWAGDDGSADWRDGFDTLYTVLEAVTRVAAPLLPLISEDIWRGLTGGRSIHLEDWPDKELFPEDDDLVAAMDLARETASVGLALRKKHGLRVRLPLSSLKVVSSFPQVRSGFDDILRDELNVKDVEIETFDVGSFAKYGIELDLTINARELGPRIGRDVQRVIAAAKAGDWRSENNSTIAGGLELEPNEYTLNARSSSGGVAFLENGDFIVLDTTVTAELEAEGLARDVVRAVQQARKDAGLEVSDRITLTLAGDPAAVAAIETHRDLIGAETLATSLQAREADGGTVPVGTDSRIAIEVERV